MWRLLLGCVAQVLLTSIAKAFEGPDILVQGDIKMDSGDKTWKMWI